MSIFDMLYKVEQLQMYTPGNLSEHLYSYDEWQNVADGRTSWKK